MPAGVDRATFTVIGASGASSATQPGGRGGGTVATIATTPGRCSSCASAGQGPRRLAVAAGPRTSGARRTNGGTGSWSAAGAAARVRQHTPVGGFQAPGERGRRRHGRFPRHGRVRCRRRWCRWCHRRWLRRRKPQPGRRPAGPPCARTDPRTRAAGRQAGTRGPVVPLAGVAGGWRRRRLVRRRRGRRRRRCRRRWRRQRLRPGGQHQHPAGRTRRQRKDHDQLPRPGQRLGRHWRLADDLGPHRGVPALAA